MAERVMSNHATMTNLLAALSCGRAAYCSGVNVGITGSSPAVGAGGRGGPPAVGVAIVGQGK